MERVLPRRNFAFYSGNITLNHFAMANRKTRGRSREKSGQANSEKTATRNVENAAAMNTTAIGLVVAGAVGTALGLLFGTERGQELRMNLMKNARQGARRMRAAVAT